IHPFPLCVSTSERPAPELACALPRLPLPGRLLSLRHFFSPRGAAISICYRLVPIRRSTTVLWIVLPVAVYAAVPVSCVGAVIVVHVVIVAVDVNVVIAAPSGIPAPASSAPCPPHCNPHAEPHTHSSG